MDKGTDLLVWRDSKTAPSGANGRRACGTKPAWFPLSQTDVVAFDQTENPSDLCFLPDNVSPVIGGTQSCFPLSTQRIHVSGGNTLAADMGVPFKRGWLYLNLNQTLASGDPYPGLAQAWVTTLHALPNGNLIVGNCHAGPDQPQLFEVTRDKKVVWTFKDWKNFGDNLAAAQVLDVPGVIR